MLTCALWGSLYPMIKVGYTAFRISTDDIPSIILFAGLRFFISGIILIALSSIKQKKFDRPEKNNIGCILLGALFAIILHYGFTYVALSFGEGSKSAIIKQVGFLFLSCFAFLFDKEDRLSPRKILAGLLGFIGIIATNSDNSGFSFAIGDLLLVLASFCSIFGSVIAKKSTKIMASARYVAYSQLAGGIFLCAVGLLLGGKIMYVDLKAVFVFAYICFASISAYLMWNILLKYNSLSKLAIIKFTEPLFAVVFSGLILHENIFKLSYLIALVLMLAAIIIENVKGKDILKHIRRKA